MSYDISIRSDKQYTQTAALHPLRAFLATRPERRSGTLHQFVYGDGQAYYMEIDLESVSADGDSRQAAGPEAEQVNCIRAHIPYAYWGETEAAQRPYLEICLAIARHLGWAAYDEQQDKPLA